MAEDYKDVTAKMKKTTEVLSTQFDSVRAGRANAAVLDQIRVEYYGAPTPINQIATIATPDPRSLSIQPWDGSRDFVRLVWMGLSDLVTGGVGLKDLSGPVGIVGLINDVGENSATKTDAVLNIAYLAALIAVNLAVMNLLPIPALDGGRLFFLVITALIEGVFRRKLNPKYEGYVHAAGFVLLLGLMAVVMVSDIYKLIA